LQVVRLASIPMASPTATMLPGTEVSQWVKMAVVAAILIAAIVLGIMLVRLTNAPRIG
jgi:hypothetical protein